MNTDPQSPIPRYSQIKRMISARIQSGDWRPGDRIASESEMVRDMGVSRMTINRALRELTLEGQLIRVQGVGTFVAESKAQAALFEVKNIADEIHGRGSRHEAKVILLRREAASDQTARLFEMKSGDETYHSILLHLENDTVQGSEPRLEKLAVRFDPFGLGGEGAAPKCAGPHPSELAGGDEPCPLKNVDMLFHARQRHLEFLGEARDRRVRPSELLEHATAGRVGKRRKG